MAQDYLDSNLGGGIPEDARGEITVKVVASGRGNEEEGGGGACCTAFQNTNGVSTMRPFFDVAHPHWNKPANARPLKFWTQRANQLGGPIHEYTHVWQHHLGCISQFWQPLGTWLNEGLASYIAHEALIEGGHQRRIDVIDHMTHSARVTGQLDRPFQDFAEGSIRDIGIHPGHVGYLAVARLVESSPNGILSLRTICEEVADGASVPVAFETAFGISLDDFYAEFEEYRKEVNPTK